MAAAAQESSHQQRVSLRARSATGRRSKHGHSTATSEARSNVGGSRSVSQRTRAEAHTQNFSLGVGWAVTLTLYIIYVRFSKLGYTNHVKISQPTSSSLTGKIKNESEKKYIF